jgi:glycosyltransferase involved in cell wall biosynthesis
MKVLYDHQIFEHQRIGGVSRYFTEIIKHLPSDVEFDVSVQYSFNEYLKEVSEIDFVWKDQLIHHFLPNLNFRGKKRLFSFLEQKYPAKYPNFYQLNREATIKKIQEGNFDIFHPTFFEDYYLDHLNGKPYVLTVHDTIIELFPEFINSPGFVKRKKKLIEHAAHIIAVSENTKQDIINVFDTAPDKISVTYHASSLIKTEDKLDILPEKYLLYVGDRRLGYKNFAFFISAIQPILLEQNDLFLVCTGDSFTTDEIEFFAALGIQDKIKIIFVEDTQMYNLYHKAQMFIYPSYYEGFGIPILEAFQAECPVILTDNSCFPEVAEDAGLYFSHKSPQELRRQIIDLLNNQQLRQNLIEKGNKRLSNFSWENTAKQTVEIYKKVLNIN